MSPMLFSLFIEDLELFIQDSPTSGLTIDDITFYTITICPSYDCSYNLWTNEWGFTADLFYNYSGYK